MENRPPVWADLLLQIDLDFQVLARSKTNPTDASAHDRGQYGRLAETSIAIQEPAGIGRGAADGLFWGDV